MPTHPRKQPADIQIAMEILKEAAEPRQTASVKEAFEKNKGEKTRAAKVSAKKRSLLP